MLYEVITVVPNDGLLAGAEVQSNSVSIRPVANLQMSISRDPALDFADPDHSPAMIIVAMDGNDLFSPRPAIILKDT